MEIYHARSCPWDGQIDRYVTHLTEEERSLVEMIDLRMWPSEDERMKVLTTNEDPVLLLMSSMAKHRGIREQRWRYRLDPVYQVDRTGRTSKGEFERNGIVGDNAYIHAHFVPYLRYFLFGAYLPDFVIEEFEEQVGNPEIVTSGDIVPMGKLARELTKRNDLYRDGAALEFFKLCLDIGLDPGIARSVRRAVMQIRPSSAGRVW